jgi:hypothetical protein
MVRLVVLPLHVMPLRHQFRIQKKKRPWTLTMPVGTWKYQSSYKPMTVTDGLLLPPVIISYWAHNGRSFVDIHSHRYPAEALTRTQALRGMTCDAAYVAFAEDTRGRLAPGFAADFVVLDRDIMHVPSEEILGTKVLATVVDGHVAYGSF